MRPRTIRLKSIWTAAAAGTVFLACNKGGSDSDGNHKDKAKGASADTGVVPKSPAGY